MEGQLVNCTTYDTNGASTSVERFRCVLNGAVMSPIGMGKCVPDPDGFCDLDIYTAALQQQVGRLVLENSSQRRYISSKFWTLLNVEVRFSSHLDLLKPTA